MQDFEQVSVHPDRELIALRRHLRKLVKSRSYARVTDARRWIVTTSPGQVVLTALPATRQVVLTSDQVNAI